MAPKRDLAAEKARKQKIVLAVAGVLLVGLAAIQVPKLMGGDSEPAAAPAAETTSTAAAVTPAPTATGAVTPTAASTAKPVVFVAGVGLPGTPVVPPAKSQLASFTLFSPSDPFVQQVNDGTATSGEAAPAAEEPSADAAKGDASGGSTGGGVTGGSDGGTAATQAPAITYATIMFEGKPQQLQVKDKFPKGDPMFVLVSLKKKQAKIGVAGGSFDDSATLTLALGKKVTLVNTATGVRYELKLVYTGSEPETIESFTTKADQAGDTGGQDPAPASGSTVSAIPDQAP